MKKMRSVFAFLMAVAMLLSLTAVAFAADEELAEEEVVEAVEEPAAGSQDNLKERQYSATRQLLCGGLKERQPEITLARAGELISEHIACGGSLEDIVNECALALSRAGFFAGEAE